MNAARARGLWIAVAACLAAVWVVMGWATTNLLRMEQEQIQSRAEAELEERARLALWRLDGLLPARLSLELAQVRLSADGLPVQPPTEQQGILARFEINATGTFRTFGGSRVSVLDDLDGTELTAQLQRPDALAEPPIQLATKGSSVLSADANQSLRNTAEFSKRKLTIQDNLKSSYYSSVAQMGQQDAFGRGSTEVENAIAEAQRGLDSEGKDAEIVGTVQAVWDHDVLLVARLVRTGNAVTVHGSVLDWPTWREQLASEVSDLLPDAKFEPSPGEVRQGRQLASLPVALDAGPLEVPDAGFSPLAASMVAGWIVVILTTGGVTWLTASSLRLSERRANFVSAVTHELRTPLTTFRMYAEMLEGGMVDESKRSKYLGTLRREADRLGHLVENVLAYARIESRKGAASRETMRVADILDRMRARLEDRASQADLELQVEVDPEVAKREIEVDPTAIEQILFNLVDNAAKYAPSDDDPILELSATETQAGIALRLRDHGPGIPDDEVRTVFEPFAKAKAHASGTKPGVGIGLALSRDLARQMGGELKYEPARPGAAFILELPRA
jgi:signal transduction histidine kinase